MGIITAAALILTTQKIPSDAKSLRKIVPLVESGAQVSKARLNEIWDHIDNRFVTQSDVWFELGEFPSCVSLLKVQAAASPDDYDLMTSLAWMLENIDRYDDAQAVYLDFGTRHPKNGDAMYDLGRFYYQKKDYANTIKVLEPTLALNPGPNTYRTLARAYELSGKPNDAIRIWELELKRFPNELTAIANIKRVKAKMAGGGK